MGALSAPSSGLIQIKAADATHRQAFDHTRNPHKRT